ncbi:hypothetical protein F8M41_024603 [Gigaspora margarita]|uniref:CBM20 domain-containing protein n=1 Tax=Gigaspora margarita TaxID=4874 RepID=A0A8H4AAS1_GIGMA|nr:hypothetical protein F8M41_024603 [Gigaspora margarita]
MNILNNCLNSNKNKDDDISLFHVHIPFNTGSYRPIILGSCEALGFWKTKVWLHQTQDPTHWVSDPVQIPHVHGEYKYCLVSPENKSNIEEGCKAEPNRRI